MSMGQLLLVFGAATEPPAIEQWVEHCTDLGATPTIYQMGATTVLVTDGRQDLPGPGSKLPPPLRSVRIAGPLRLGNRELVPAGTIVEAGGMRIGGDAIAVVAGPCAVESREQLLATARAVAEHGAVGLRGGAFKPRTSPYAFQGMHWQGLDLLADVRDEVGLPVVTEVVDPAHVARMAKVADVLQIGARNTQNFALLTEVGRSGRPVVLKRGFGITIDEFTAAAEYLLVEGNDQVILCERGIRTFEHATRFTLDLSAVALLKRRTHLPVMVDPSHASGLPELVAPLTIAAAGAGADALLIDVHLQPEQARCDGPQALLPAEFGDLMARLGTAALGLGRVLADRHHLAEVVGS